VSNPVPGLADDTWPNPPQPRGTLVRFDVVKGKPTPLSQKVSDFALSADGSAIAYVEVDGEGAPAAIHVMPSMGGNAGGGQGAGNGKGKK